MRLCWSEVEFRQQVIPGLQEEEGTALPQLNNIFNLDRIVALTYHSSVIDRHQSEAYQGHFILYTESFILTTHPPFPSPPPLARAVLKRLSSC
jgi:hypothetical protein